MPTLDLAYNSAINSLTSCSPNRAFLGRQLVLPHLANLPQFEKDKYQHPPFSLEEKVYECMGEQNELRIRRQFKVYTNQT